ncbi:hypothetical protein C2G38_2075852 [Gigaspora rosea]|uniref:Uncharacterized protein n=1 Tax=Gigaspora rosea TaxID=44941 RepID=A0A397VIR6_9GLOM|nr:hypothetical protein C2G38_2075852 [Gigaspora rosea]
MFDYTHVIQSFFVITKKSFLILLPLLFDQVTDFLKAPCNAREKYLNMVVTNYRVEDCALLTVIFPQIE